MTIGNRFLSVLREAAWRFWGHVGVKTFPFHLLFCSWLAYSPGHPGHSHLCPREMHSPLLDGQGSWGRATWWGRLNRNWSWYQAMEEGKNRWGRRGEAVSKSQCQTSLQFVCLVQWEIPSSDVDNKHMAMTAIFPASWGWSDTQCNRIEAGLSLNTYSDVKEHMECLKWVKHLLGTPHLTFKSQLLHFSYSSDWESQGVSQPVGIFLPLHLLPFSCALLLNLSNKSK